MALPATGLISLSAVNTELGKNASSVISLNDSNVRALAGKSSGPISLADLHGKALQVSNSIIAGSGIETGMGMTVYGWNSVGSMGVPIIGSATPNPIPMTPYGGLLNGVYWYDGFQWLETIITGFSGNFYITINGTRYLMTNGGFSQGYYYAYCETAIPSTPFYMDGRPTSISFG